MNAGYLLEVLNGASAGTRYPMAPGSYRVIARAESRVDATMQLAAGGGNLLAEEAMAIADRHVSSRATHPGHRLKNSQRDGDVVLDDAGISRTHAMVFLGEGGLSVVDLMSTNGTLINGQPASDADLVAGDVLKVGQTELRVLVEG